MLKILRWLLGMGVVAAFAHGPTPQKSDHQIIIKAQFGQVWDTLKSPSGLCTWHPLVKRCQVNGNMRVIELDGGERLSEEILEIDEKNHIVYVRQTQPNVKALPVSSYSYRLEAEDTNAGVIVRWKARYYRGDTSNFPPPELNDETAVQAMDKWIQTGLEGLRANCEKTGS